MPMNGIRIAHARKCYRERAATNLSENSNWGATVMFCKENWQSCIENFSSLIWLTAQIGLWCFTKCMKYETAPASWRRSIADWTLCRIPISGDFLVKLPSLLIYSKKYENILSAHLHTSCVQRFHQLSNRTVFWLIITLLN